VATSPRPRPHPRTGRFAAGIFVDRGEHGLYVAQVFLRTYGDLTADEVFAHQLRYMPPERSVEVAIAQARAWALEYIPQAFGIDAALLDVTVMAVPLFV
jgi:hypothetical protein